MGGGGRCDRCVSLGGVRGAGGEGKHVSDEGGMWGCGCLLWVVGAVRAGGAGGHAGAAIEQYLSCGGNVVGGEHGRRSPS